MIDEADIKALQDRFDMRYRQIVDCVNEMDAVRQEHMQMYVDIASIKKSVDSLTWLARTTLGAVIAAIVGLVIAVVK